MCQEIAGEPRVSKMHKPEHRNPSLELSTERVISPAGLKPNSQPGGLPGARDKSSERPVRAGALSPSGRHMGEHVCGGIPNLLH